jgi:hypothetical protein
MLKPQTPKVNVWKANETKGHDQRKVRKPKPQKFQAKSQKPNCNKYASLNKNSKPEKPPHHQNRPWNNYDTSMLIPSYRSYNRTLWGSYHDMSYFCSPWSLGMSSPPIYFYLVSIPHAGLSASRSSPAHNERSYSKDQSIGKVKHQVIKQVWRVKKDLNVKKSSDLTLQDKKPDSHKSANIIDQSCPKQDLAGQKPHSTGGQGVEKKKNVKSKLSFDKLLAKYKREIEQKKGGHLGDETRGQTSSSPPRSKVSSHYQHSSNWS